MKSIIIWLTIQILSAMVCFAEPIVDCTVKEFPPIPGQMVIIIEGNEDIKEMKLATPIDRDSYKRFGEKKFIFIWPKGLPIYPTLFFLVNGKELHYVPQLDMRQFQTKSAEPV